MVLSPMLQSLIIYFQNAEKNAKTIQSSEALFSHKNGHERQHKPNSITQSITKSVYTFTSVIAQ
jgi:hypothetical protein